MSVSEGGRMGDAKREGKPGGEGEGRQTTKWPSDEGAYGTGLDLDGLDGLWMGWVGWMGWMDPASEHERARAGGGGRAGRMAFGWLLLYGGAG